MKLMKIFVVLLVFFALTAFLNFQAYAIEIIATPQKNPFAPNDWIEILLEIDGYQGGPIDWIAAKPDGTTVSGQFSSLSGEQKMHSISRTAFDNQFGEWIIKYQYKTLSKSVAANVEPLILELKSDKKTYLPEDTAKFEIFTNYFEPKASLAESYHIEIHNADDVIASHIDDSSLKAYQESTIYNFEIGELIKNNPFGDYKIIVEYFNTRSELPFSVKSENTKSTIFIGTNKIQYKAGEIVEVQLIFSDLVSSNVVLTITDPKGIISTRTFPIEQSLTRVILDDISTLSPGTYTIEAQYGGNKGTKKFFVEFDDEKNSNKEIELNISLEKLNFRPGEIIAAQIQTRQLLADNINYWLEDPNGKPGIKINIPMSSGNLVIPYSIPKDSILGPWKFYINYAGAERYSIFFVEGKPVEQEQILTTQKYEGPEVLLTIGETISLNNPQGISIDSNNDIYLVDSGNFQIKKFDSNGRLADSWGSFGSQEGQFKNPTGIFVDSNYIHVVDTGNSRIQTFEKDGKFVRAWGNSGISIQSLVQPLSLSRDSTGNFFVSDGVLNKISKYDENGNYVGEIESLLTSSAKFSSSNDIISDGNDNFYIVVSKDDRILEFNSNGHFVTSFGSEGEDNGKFQQPSAIAVDKMGNLYIGDSGNSRIQVFDANHKFKTKWGSLGNGLGQFNKISEIAVDSDGNIFVVDSQNSKIQKFASLEQKPELKIPDWIKNNAQWWNDGTISDSDFASGIEFMIKEKIIEIPNLQKSTEISEEKIPQWVKNNAGWWSEGLISDKEFANGIEFLVKNGIIQI